MFRLYFDKSKKFAVTSLTALVAVLGFRLVLVFVAPFLYSGAISALLFFCIALAYSVCFVSLASYAIPKILTKFRIGV